jgi:hypothetical protein
LLNHHIAESQIPVTDELLDRVEQEYAPPDHAVFQLVPLEFDQRANVYYAEIHRPVVNSTTFWDVYLQLLERFQTNNEANMDLLTLISAHTDVIQDVNDERLDLLPGLKELREGGAVVGRQNVDGDLQVAAGSSVFVDFTDSDSCSGSDSSLEEDE